MSINEYNQIIAEIKREFPKFEIIVKTDSALMKTLNVIIKYSTFGKVKDFMTRYATTFGYIVYVPSEWKNLDRIEVLCHERVHMRQMRRYGRLWFMFTYLFLLPTVFAYFRKRYEQEAYEGSMSHAVLHGGIKMVEDKDYRENVIKSFTSASYFWTWPFRESIEIWYDTVVENLRVSEISENNEVTPVLISPSRRPPAA